MIRIKLQRSTLLIDATDNPSILGGAHRSFFELAAGYERDSAQNQYSLNDPMMMSEVLLDTVEYLKDEDIPFEVDSQVQERLNEIAGDQQSYHDATAIGLQVKTSLKIDPLEIPGFQRKLKPYQTRSVHHLVNVFNGANFSVPGSGKTTIIYAAFAILRARNIVDKLLVIGPRSCFMPWEDEYLKCFGKTAATARLTGSNRHLKYFAAEDYELFLCTYQTAAIDKNELASLCQKYRVFLVLDESHNVKKFEGGVHAPAVLSIAGSATRRAILTGTPAPNSYEDLWTQMTFLWPGKQMLGTREQYANRAGNEEEWPSIQKAIKPFFVRIQKTELGLPPQRFERILVSMNQKQGEIYKVLSARILSELSVVPEDRQKLREWRKAKMVRLLQAASNPTLLAKRSDEFDVPPLSGKGVPILQILENYPKYEKPAKFEKAVSLIRKLVATGNKVLLWTVFVHNIEMLFKELQDLEPQRLYGGIPKDAEENEELNREDEIRKFRESSSHMVMLANPAACAESISLHKICHHAIYLDRTFDCGRYLQSLDRIHRIGLEPNEDVFYHILQCSDTIDETIDQRLEEKQTAMRRLLEDEDISIVTFDLPEGDKSALGKESDEQDDFDATIDDLKKHAKHSSNA